MQHYQGNLTRWTLFLEKETAILVLSKNIKFNLKKKTTHIPDLERFPAIYLEETKNNLFQQSLKDRLSSAISFLPTLLAASAIFEFFA